MDVSSIFVAEFCLLRWVEKKNKETVCKTYPADTFQTFKLRSERKTQNLSLNQMQQPQQLPVWGTIHMALYFFYESTEFQHNWRWNKLDQDKLTYPETPDRIIWNDYKSDKSYIFSLKILRTFEIKLEKSLRGWKNQMH